MPTFMTTSRDIARRFRTAYLTGRVIDGTVCGQSFTRAKVCSVKRDPLSVAGRWRIRIEPSEETPPNLTLAEP